MLILKKLIFDDIVEALFTALYSIVLAIASLVYDAVNFIYQVYMAIASAQIFNDSIYKEISSRIYIVIGIVALFFIAYGLLRAIIDPDGAQKGDNAPNKIVQNVLIAVLLLMFTPTLFRFAFTVQNVIVKDDVIGKLILGGSYNESPTSSYAEAGRSFASDIFISFFLPPTADEAKDTAEVTCDYDTEEVDTCLAKVEKDGKTLLETKNEVQEKMFFIKYAAYASEVAKGNIKYNWLFQLIVGGLMVYVLISLCIDLGIRAIKLAYYQLIAPIPILTKIIPGQKKIFDNWLKGIVSTFLLVFLQLAVVLFGVWLMTKLPGITKSAWNAWNNSTNGIPPIGVRVFARAFIICGIIIFMKQAPKLITSMFGLSEGSFKLGIADKLREGGVFAAGGAVAAAGTAMLNKAAGIPRDISRFKNNWSTASGKQRAGMVGKAIAGGAAAPWRGLVRFGRAGVEGYKSSKDVKSVAEFAEAVQKGVARGLSEPTLDMKVTGTVTDVGRTMGTTIKTDYTPYDSVRELRKAKRYDEVKSKLDDINTLTDAERQVKAVDDVYNARIDFIKKQIEDGTIKTPADLAKAQNDIKKLRKDWLSEKNKARHEVIADKLTDGDLKTKSLLEAYANSLVENRGIIKDSILQNYANHNADGTVERDDYGNIKWANAKGKVLYDHYTDKTDEELKEGILNGKDFIFDATNNINIAREPAKVSGQSSTAIHQRAMEEEAKKSGK